jgi:A/G-specific adenine glycosylase
LLRWYDSARRNLPWRESNDFYCVWISEVMLQQTRVEAVIPYYLRFLQRFPSIESLAAAADNDLLSAWSGLGYYSRARNLHRAAKHLAVAGRPKTYEDVLSLPGAGPYTAAAIASIALDLPHAAVDGNVMRVVSRLTNDASEISSVAARRTFAAEAGAMLDRARPGDFNQAMMELGATICLPRTPDCPRCPVQEFCAARAAGTERSLPVKLKKAKARDMNLDLLILQNGAQIYLVRRSAAERRLADFWELPERCLIPRIRGRKLGEFRHQIVNDRFTVSIWRARSVDSSQLPPGSWFGPASLKDLPLTTITKKALQSI